MKLFQSRNDCDDVKCLEIFMLVDIMYHHLLKYCALLLRSHLLSNSTLSILGNIPSDIEILILQGENDTFTPVQQAYLIQQKLRAKTSKS
jgi:fermentation-respiration switch protein FrsA (DUF1100 family)